jgi:hypothetical protein
MLSTTRIAPLNALQPWDVRTDAQRLQDAQDAYLEAAPHEAPYASMLDFTNKGWTLGEEAFLTVDPDEWDGFIEAAGDECRDGPEAASVIMAAAYDELARRVAARDAYPFIADDRVAA